MSKPKLVAVVATVSERLPLHDPHNRVTCLFWADENYSLPAVQRFFDRNRAVLGAPLRARYELARFKNAKRMLAWAERKHPGPGGLEGWTGPLWLAPEA